MKKIFSVFTMVLLLLSVSTATFAASNENSADQKQLPILSVSPGDGSTGVSPDAPIQIHLDKNVDTFNRFKGQFEKGSFVVSLNGNFVSADYDSSAQTITVSHETLSRYATQTVEVKTKAAANNSKNQSNNASFSFSFKTGSAIGEATHLTAEVENNKVSTKDESKIHVTVTDDYGNPATNVTVSAKGEGSDISSDPIQIGENDQGKGTLSVKDTKAETVNLTITSQDNVYSDDVDTQSVEKTIEFYSPSKIKEKAEHVLLLKDVNPWDSNIWDESFQQNNLNYTAAGSSDLSTVNFDNYDRIVVASDQPQAFYNALENRINDLNQWVSDGGALYFDGADNGWQIGHWTVGPNNISNYHDGQFYNYVMKPDSPLLNGVPSVLTFGAASHNVFTQLPNNAVVLMSATQDGSKPTLVTFEQGNGTVLASTETIELSAKYDSGWKKLWNNLFDYMFLGSEE